MELFSNNISNFGPRAQAYLNQIQSSGQMIYLNIASNASEIKQVLGPQLPPDRFQPGLQDEHSRQQAQLRAMRRN